jgi:LmbE family N-acetylglucosaminyl deacetylase
MSNSDNTFTLLACMAHPSDESFSIGGTLALYSKRGVKVHVLSATGGEVGEMDPALLVGFSSIAERRASELRCAAGILGLAGVHFLGYRDSGMPGSPDNQHPNALAAQAVDEAAARVAHYIRLVKPQVVVTHDPIGGYKHPDHIALHRATLRAFDLAGDVNFQADLPPWQPLKLYYQTMPKNLMRWAVRLGPVLGMDPRHFGRNGDIDLVSLVEEGDFPTHARIDCRSVSALRDAASACHISQGGGRMGPRGLMTLLRRFIGSTENFMRAYPAPEMGLREMDLFEGLE